MLHRVGVASNNHEAIRNVLMGCLAALEGDDPDITLESTQLAHKVSGGGDGYPEGFTGITRATSNDDLALKEAHVVGGTAFSSRVRSSSRGWTGCSWMRRGRSISRTWSPWGGLRETSCWSVTDAWSPQAGFAQVAPVKGVEGFNRASPVTGPTYVDATVAGKRLRRGARLWTVATSTFKAETYRFLRQDRPAREEIAAGASFPPGTVHRPDWADGKWLKQLTAEQLVTVKTRHGFARLEWQSTVDTARARRALAVMIGSGALLVR